MTVLWTAAEAAAATGGAVSGDWAATGVSIDTRTLAQGDLFVALTAARDGHDFVAQALDKGAAAAMVSRIPDGVDAARCLLVRDVLDALVALGRAGRARTGARVIGVTGSVGKTTVKEMLRTALSAQGRTHAAEASYNNHWGVPLTLARMPADTEYAVIEIGMNAPGEIAPLARMARPHVAMVTIVAGAHLEAFGTLDGIAHEKASIYEGLEPGGIAIANADVDTAPILCAKAKTLGARLIRVGEAEGADLRLLDARIMDEATVIRAQDGGVERLLKLAAPGRHLALNALMALAGAEAAGADGAETAMALGQWRPVAGRGTRERLVLSQTDDIAIDLIDDAFNANPASLAAGLEVLAGAVPVRGGRRIAILGDMLELGPEAAAMHAAIADLPSLAAVDVVHCSGPLMRHLHAVLPGAKRGLHADTADDLAQRLPRELRPGDIVLVKGSKGSRVSRVVDALRKLGQAAADDRRGPP
ncbi:UDP-N-acetylmuramoylalanyl-D-glutamyl-2,6- diaminopimelate--D-alanyl-D-alanine ligase [Roseibacterium elongatum DSM 19469]|uniref:UDP-N-acetylmuramoyl-tripeptide--D-alanyl-D-alanine ligase n=1 Tax=Roseicyclus elongatus DSM 19469 TaxID=1294273 RepID=W8RWW2_9RHOB|nr:UDP-N-acetylmuramoyl-tripeptide--D-alanyl-D-alanine ligase [Roseibacterium elongatum]AHM05704.1 UDP-N-acetylmuramoylalanyl-D-glutamyl-2,6- diaminopimelate--D-alanyl-D-alanine ligase [Roseibacterium elongatum DSM 19469]